MRILEFTATEAGSDNDGYALVAYVRHNNPHQYVMFQRDVELDEEDWGIYFEFNDQINSKYECIRRCSVTHDRLIVELAEPIDCQKHFPIIDIKLKITPAELEEFAAMLRRIFRRKESLLAITVQDD